MTFGHLYFCSGLYSCIVGELAGMFCSDICWLLGGAWFQCRYGGFWMSSCQLMFPGVRGVFWCSQALDLSLLPLAFSLTLTRASRLLHPYSTNDKTSRLMVKRFSIVRDTQRGSQSYMEKRRGRMEIEVTRRRRGGIKRGESNLASNQFPICSSQSGTLRQVHRVHREKKREERDRGDQEERRGVKRRETSLSCDQFPKCSP